MDEAHARRKTLLQCPYLYLPSWTSILSSHCLLKQQDPVPTFTTEPSKVRLWQCVFCAMPFIFYDWCEASSIERWEGSRGYFPSLSAARVAKTLPLSFFFPPDKLVLARTELKPSLHTSTSRLRLLDTLFLGLYCLEGAGQDESHMAHKNKLAHDEQGVNNKQDWIRHTWKSWKQQLLYLDSVSSVWSGMIWSWLW